MFTGIIEHTGTVISLDTAGDSAILRVRAGSIARDLAAGGSLAVDGVCLTALGTEADPEVFTADVMGESLARTTLGRLRPGDAVNLERCLPAGGRFDGHIVQGHVDATGTIAAITEHPAWTTLRVTVPAHLAPQLAEKGSIALNGISLTVTRTSPAEAAALAEAMRQAVSARPVSAGGAGVTLSITISAGVSTLTPDLCGAGRDRAAALLLRADGALMSAKRAGRNRLMVAGLDAVA